MTRKFLSSNVADERIASRDGRFSLFDGRLLDAGGFLIDWDGYKELKTFDEIVRDGHAIIVAEGGMGKSHIQREFCKTLGDKSRYARLELVSSADDVQGLKEAIKDASQDKEYLFLDGLDEAENLAAVLLGMLQGYDGHAHIIIASRGIPRLNLLSERLNWPMYSLLPYSRDDVQELCNEANVDYDAFMRKVDRQNLGGVCSKPLGCMMLIEQYRQTALNGFSSESLWRTSLMKLCAENTESKTRDFVSSEKVVPVEEGIRIATVIALALKLSGRTLVYCIGNKPVKDGELDFSMLFSNKDAQEAFNTLLLRPLFLNVAEGCYRFSHSSYVDFLAAQGMIEYLDEREWGKIVFAPEGAPYPQWEGVLPWLAARSNDILRKVKKSRPDLLLGTDALVDKLGADEICKAILDHAEEISSSVRNSPAVQARYYALNTDKCARTIRKVLKTEKSEAVLDTAIDIIRRARLISVTGLLVEMFCDECLDLSLRKSAGYALIELGDKRQRSRCKKVLHGPRVNQLKGIVLRMAWPDLMSVEELIPLLGTKSGKVTDSFSMWLEHDGFVASLSRLSSKDKLKLLSWAVSEIKEHDDRLDCLAEARRSVFLHCWKEERSRRFVPLLAKGIVAYDATYQSPFGNDNDEWRDSSHIFSDTDFSNDVERRREIAKHIVEDTSLPVDAVYGCWMQLLRAEDGEFVVMSLDATANPAIRERWANCLRYIGYMKLPERTNLWNKLHQEFPKIYSCDAATALAEAEKRDAEFAARRLDFKRASERREAKDRDIISRNVAWAHKVLRRGEANGRFVSLMEVLRQQRPKGTKESLLDFRANTLWPSLSEDDRRKLVEAAYDFLLKCKGPWSDGQTCYPIYAEALCLLYSCGRDKLDRMPVKVWKKVGPELLRYLDFEKFELLLLTVGYFRKLHNRIFREMFFKHSKSQLHAEKFWKIKEARNFFSGKEFTQLLESLDEDNLTDEQRYNLYDRFFEADYDVTANYVRKKYTSVLLRGMGLRIVGCVLLSSPHRFQEFLKELASDAKWGVRWAELVLPREAYHHATITRLLPRLPVRIIKEFYVWLNVHFPPEKEPYHEGAWFCDEKDNLYRAKTFVFNELMSRIEPEAVDAVEELQRRFPKGKWFHDCALRLQHKLLAVRCPIFNAGVVRKLLEGKKRGLVINRAEDLLRVVMDSLARYQTYLTGVDTPQVRYLWNEHDGAVVHRSEEDLSDHLKAFLKQDFRKIVANREVQLNRGRKGRSGARTDIWVNAIADNQAEPLSLCIEVKGSWNPEVRTAYKAQLVEKYMDDGGAQSGIFLVGWFESKRELKKTSVGIKRDIVRLLAAQDRQLIKSGYKVSHKILDCSF